MVRRRVPSPGRLADWDEVKARHVQEWVITLLGRYSDCYANNQFRALQQFFKWHATEDPDEPRANPMAGLKPPKIGDKLVPVFTADEVAALLGTCKGGGFPESPRLRNHLGVQGHRHAAVRVGRAHGRRRLSA